MPQFIDIFDAPVALWTAPQGLCINSTLIDLNTLLDPSTPTGGTWMVSGTSTSIFDPSLLGPGNHVVSYTIGTLPCESTLEQIITVDPLPDPSWTSPGSICEDESAITLDALLNGTATTGGNWTVNGNAATIFNPATLGAGTHTVVYTAGTAPCTDQLTQTIEIVEQGDTPQPVCGVSTTSSVEFIWPDVTGASSYTVTVISGAKWYAEWKHLHSG